MSFSIFLETFGTPIDLQEVPAANIEKYRYKPPNQLLDYWAERGWSGYAEGFSGPLILRRMKE